MKTFADLCTGCVFICISLTAICLADGPSPASAPAGRPAGEPIAQLAAGKSQGSFHLTYHGTAQLAGGGQCELAALIQDALFRDSGRMKLHDPNDFAVEADLRPGSYYLTVAPADEKNADYWPSNREQIHIDKRGRLYQMRDAWTKPGPFVLDRRMKGLSPDGGEIAAAQRPVLKWPAVAGATHYRGAYFGDARQNRFDVDETQFVIGSGIAAGDGCMWQVNALDGGGKLLARGEARFFGHGTDTGITARLRELAAVWPVGRPPGRSYLGIQPLPTQVPKDPQSPLDSMESGGTVQDEASGYIPGIMVAQVLQGSPAVDADLIPDDVIIAIDGQRVPSSQNMGDMRAFTDQIAKMPPGRKITLTVRRYPRELTLAATLAKPPGAATQPSATSEAPPNEQPVAARPAAAPPQTQEAAHDFAKTWKWSDADSGSPAGFPFEAKPNADIPPLTSKDGLAGDDVGVAAEIPKFGMAFGTNEGLSLWDGQQIRTYTGPSYSASSGATIPGNSGLPSNWVQDLLCDSRGRLWVATLFGVCRIDSPQAKRWHVLANTNANPFLQLEGTLDVQKLFETSDGTIVLGARDATIVLMDPKTDTPRLLHRDRDMNHWVTGIAEDGKHRLWFAVRGVGVLRYDGTRIEEIHGDWIKGSDVAGLAIDGQQTVWVINSIEGLGALHADGTSGLIGADVMPADWVQHLVVDRAGRLWAVTSAGLACHVSNDARADKAWQYAAVPASGGEQWPTTALNTSDNNWWILGSGATRKTELKLTSLNPRAGAFDDLKREVERTYPKVAADNHTLIAAGKVVVGVADRRVLRFDGKTWEDLGAKLGRVDVSQLFADSKGTIWIATSGDGLIGLDPGGAIRRFNNQPDHAMSVIYCIAETPDGSIYAGTQHGVYRSRGKTWEHLESDLFQVGQVLVDRVGRVWMLEITYDKLYAYDGNFFHEVKEQTAISKERLVVGSLRLDDAGNVLIDIPPRPAENVPKRTFKWEASKLGKIGPPTEVK